MARPIKTGIDYFPFDIDFFNDEKIQFVSARFGIKGEIISIRLLCRIYRNGYYTEWNDDAALLFAKGVGDECQDSFVKDVVYELLKRGFFDRSIFERFSILTSSGIQNRYVSATYERKHVEINSDIWLINMPKNSCFKVNRTINTINRTENSINRAESTQSKVNKKGISKDIPKKEEFPNVNSLSNCKQPDPSGFQNGQHVSIDFEKLICWFNETTKGVFGVIRTPLGEKRKKMLRARILEHGKESFLEVVNNAINSDFMRGQNSRGWTATFDWLIKPTNYEKVLSDNFKNQQNVESIQRANGTGNKRPTPDELNAAVEIGLALAEGAKNG